MLRVAICDENHNFVNVLGKRIVEILENQVILSLHENYFSLQTFLIDEMKGNWDIVYLNTRVGTCDGISEMKEISEKYPHIMLAFFSEHIEDVKKIFFVDPFYFFYKPMDRDLLRHSLLKARNVAGRKKKETITIATSNGRNVQNIEIGQIYYIESNARQVTIVQTDMNTTVYMKMDEIEGMLPTYFVRCHQSYIINPDKVKSYNKNGILLYRDVPIPISRSRIEYTIEQLDNHFRCLTKKGEKE